MFIFQILQFGRSVSDNEIDEVEFLFRQFEKDDPAHCFRRYVCDLATGKLNEKPSHTSINKLVQKVVQSKSATFEYGVAYKFGKSFKNLKQCEEIYDCPLTGQQLDQIFN